MKATVLTFFGRFSKVVSEQTLGLDTQKVTVNPKTAQPLIASLRADFQQPLTQGLLVGLGH